MTCLVWVLVTSLFLRVLCEFPSTEKRLREKRSLVYPSPVAKVQAIMGAGFPVDLQDESVIIGIVIKAYYGLPRNASDYTNPNVFYARKKRDTAGAGVTTSRWDVYKVLEQYAEAYGLGGKECLLRTICELSEVPVDKSRGILEEIVHVLFRPSTTHELVQRHSDNDYFAAQMLGRKAKGQCAKYFNDCSKSFVDLFTI